MHLKNDIANILTRIKYRIMNKPARLRRGMMNVEVILF